jgi:hypothetical protein
MNPYVKITLLMGACSVFGYGFAAALAGPDPIDQLRAIEARQKAEYGDTMSLPVFPDQAKPGRDKEIEVQPRGAQYRVKAGRSSVRYVACNAQRTFNSQAEYQCVTWSKARGWSKSVRWVPRYQLLPLQGALPAESAVSPIGKGA